MIYIIERKIWNKNETDFEQSFLDLHTMFFSKKIFGCTLLSNKKYAMSRLNDEKRFHKRQHPEDEKTEFCLIQFNLEDILMFYGII